MATSQPTIRKAYRRTDDYTPGFPKIKVVEEKLDLPLHPTSVLIKVHAVALNYRDANIANGGNPWPVTPHGILCNDAAGEIIQIGDKVETLKVGDRVAPIVDTANLTGREPGRSWLAADEDGVLADHIIFDERRVSKLPAHLDWVNASIIPCAGVTAWSALKGVEIGKSVLIQGTGGVAMFALKLARAAGLRVILTSSSDEKRKTPKWDEEVLRLTNGEGVDLVVEVGGASTIVKSLKCTRRGGIVSIVGYLSGPKSEDLIEVIPLSIDRRVIIRGIDAGSKHDLDDLCAAISATQMTYDDIIDSVEPWEKADEALQYVWEGKQVGKVVIKL